MKLHRGWLGMLIGALMNAALQLSTFYENWKTFRSYDLSVHEYVRQFSWLMMALTAGFFGLIGSRLQARADEREENRDIEATLRMKPPRKDKA